ncbi:hypothetical protein ACFOVU_18850 [Nocardiopsis sediminis]|uniref:DUF1795 domain-containing protein n=1 Tax=Nocardiopsis sediminis TaxID=1778267 RepID=A0ABV8FRK1_9ACTN
MHETQPETGVPPAARVPWRSLAVIVGVVLLLAVGWPIVNAAIADEKPVADGSTMSVAEGGGHEARLTFGPGWTLRPGQSTEGRTYHFTRGGVEMTVLSAVLDQPRDIDELWAGLRRIVQVDHPGAELGEPRVTMSRNDAGGWTGPLVDGDRTGRAVVYPSPGTAFAVEMTILAAPDASDDDQRAAGELASSIAFTGKGGSGS